MEQQLQQEMADEDLARQYEQEDQQQAQQQRRNNMGAAHSSVVPTPPPRPPFMHSASSPESPSVHTRENWGQNPLQRHASFNGSPPERERRRSTDNDALNILRVASAMHDSRADSRATSNASSAGDAGDRSGSGGRGRRGSVGGSRARRGSNAARSVILVY